MSADYRQSEVRTDFFESICRQKAESLPRILPEGRILETYGVTQPIITGIEHRKRKDLYQQCMESTGYVWK